MGLLDRIMRIGGKDPAGNVKGVSVDVDGNVKVSQVENLATQATLLVLNTAFGAEDFSSEATLSALSAKIITAPSTEAKQDLIKVVLDSLDGKDYATQFTLSALNTAFGAEDFSSEITLASVLTKLTELDNKIGAISNVDNMKVSQVENLATQATLLALNTAFGAEDFSSETTLAAILAKITTASSTEAKQDAIKVVLDSLDGKDYATQTTLSALNTAFGTEDFSSEITLASVLTKLTELDNKIDAISNVDNMKVSQVGNIVTEQLDETDAVVNVLTFSASIESIEIYHDEATSQDFIVNGLPLTIAGGGWRSPIDTTTASTNVTIPTGITCTVTRLV